ncbi:helix-turn-helix domain-containing protein [Vibrio splendidus]|uniref:helix-turn-helix domain-containing protein n=1 Tax=Vibrio splendidus TaxID=29497 RepID=UPI000D37BF4C|nr:helix-turn-helix domain-containing protein [Vibrio splendidus]PTO69512.1 hypothetical protein CWN96_06170 [Vibrio splendidus]
MIEFRVIDKWLSSLIARDKLFMLNLLHHEGVEAEYILSVKELSIKFVFTESMIKASLTSLVKQGVLQKHRIDTRHYCYRFTRYTSLMKNDLRFVSFQVGGEEAVPLSHYCLYSVVDNGRSVDKSWIEIVDRLSYAGRLVLFWLISKSSSTGIVTPGTKELAKFAGVGVDGVRNQLQSLISLGVITKLSSGFTGKYLYGVTNSRYGLLFSQEGKRLVHHSNLLIEQYQSNSAYEELVNSIIMQNQDGRNHQVRRVLADIHSDLLKPAIAKHLLFNLSIHCIQHPDSNFHLEALCPLSKAYQGILDNELNVDELEMIKVGLSEVMKGLKFAFDASLTFSDNW